MRKQAIALGMGIAALFGTAIQAAPVLGLNPSISSKLIGDTFTVDINISGLSSTEIVSTFDLNIYFNATMLKGLGFTLGSDIGGPWDSSLSSVLANSFDLFAYSLTYDPSKTQQENDDDLAALQTDGSFTLATLSFEAMSAGVSQIYFGTDANERDLVGREALFLSDVQFRDACVGINSPTGGENSCRISGDLPEPSSYALVGLGLLAACAPTLMMRRRYRESLVPPAGIEPTFAA